MSVSVVIPVRNRPGILRRAIKCVQCQTYPIAEIIVVDDASDDGATPQVVLEAAAADDRVHLLRQAERQGASAARNVGWRNACSEWIAFLDSDDEWKPTKITEQIAVVDDKPDVIACFTGYYTSGLQENYQYLPPENIELFDLQHSNVLGTTSSSLVRLSALQAVDGFNAKLPSCQDWDLYLRLIRTGRIVTVRKALTLFEQTGNDRITKDFSKVILGHTRIFSEILAEVGDANARRRLKSAHAFRLGQIYLHDFQQANRSLFYFIKSFIIFPNWKSVQQAKVAIASKLR